MLFLNTHQSYVTSTRGFKGVLVTPLNRYSIFKGYQLLESMIPESVQECYGQDRARTFGRGTVRRKKKC